MSARERGGRATPAGAVVNDRPVRGGRKDCFDKSDKQQVKDAIHELAKEIQTQRQHAAGVAKIVAVATFMVYTRLQPFGGQPDYA